jgi:hypothetical protein
MNYIELPVETNKKRRGKRATTLRDFRQEPKYDGTRGLRLAHALDAVAQMVLGDTDVSVDFMLSVLPSGECAVIELRPFFFRWMCDTAQRNRHNADRRNKRLAPPPNAYNYSQIDGVWVAFGQPWGVAAGWLYFPCDESGQAATISPERQGSCGVSSSYDGGR